MIGDPINETEPVSAICGACNQSCTVIPQDQGVGSYESAGYHVNVDFQLATDCCGSGEFEVINEEEK